MNKLPITDEHVVYEKNMLDVIWSSWQPEGWAAMEKLGFDKPTKQVLYNIMHEAFCVHANNLITYFLTDDSTVEKFAYFLQNYRQKIVYQVLTLGPNRTAMMADKIQFEDHKKVYEWICKKWNATCPNLN